MSDTTIAHYIIRGIDITGFADIEQCVDFLFAGDQPMTGTLVAINPEKVITAEQERGLAELIAEAEYKYADGIMVVRSIRRKYPGAVLQRVAGADLWEALMQRAGQRGTPVFLIGGKPEVLAQTRDKLAQWRVNIVGSQDGYFTSEQQQALFERIHGSGARIVTVAMGSPKQELLIKECRQVHPQALYMGVGGTYDAFTGHVKRAPKLWRQLGLEWLYRLLTQPTRWRRQLKLVRYLMYYCSGRL